MKHTLCITTKMWKIHNNLFIQHNNCMKMLVLVYLNKLVSWFFTHLYNLFSVYYTAILLCRDTFLNSKLFIVLCLTTKRKLCTTLYQFNDSEGNSKHNCIQAKLYWDSLYFTFLRVKISQSLKADRKKLFCIN